MSVGACASRGAGWSRINSLTCTASDDIESITVAAKKPNPLAEANETEPATTTEASPSFEDSVRRLGDIVERLEAGDLPLEESLALFEQGVRLSRDAQARLDAAEKRVEQLLGFDENGRPLVSPVDPE